MAATTASNRPGWLTRFRWPLALALLIAYYLTF